MYEEEQTWKSILAKRYQQYYRIGVLHGTALGFVLGAAFTTWLFT